MAKVTDTYDNMTPQCLKVCNAYITGTNKDGSKKYSCACKKCTKIEGK